MAMTQPSLGILPPLPEQQNYRLGELFAGAGGMALGAHKAKVSGKGFCHVWVNDIDKDSCDTFERNLDVGNVIVRDVKELDFGRLSDIDGLVFGFPCNDFSVVGDRHGISGHYGSLYEWGVRGLSEKEPLFFVAENVSGLASRGNDLEIILAKMESAGRGYILFPHKYRFEEYGVPQCRHRIIIVGFRKDLGIRNFEHPKPTTKGNPKTCQEALANIDCNAPNQERTNQSARVIERLKYIRPGENAFTAKDLPEDLKLNLKSGASISQIYKRLKPNEPAYTVTGSGGGGTHIYHWKENRALTNRERARLQSFPDDFEFKGGKESVRKQIGMAVPPEGAKVVFEGVLETLLAAGIQSKC